MSKFFKKKAPPPPNPNPNPPPPPTHGDCSSGEDDSPKVNNTNRLFRAKKKIASQLLNSSTGRKQTTKLIGKAGDSILTALFACVEMIEGKKFAKQFSIDLLKFVTKVALLYQNRNLNNQMMVPLSPFISEVLYTVVSTIGLDVRHGSAAASHSGEHRSHILHNTSHISANIMLVHDGFLPLLKTGMQEKNRERFTRTCNYLTSEKFINEFFLNVGGLGDGKLKEHKMTILTNTQQMMNSSTSNRRETDQFLHNELQKRRDLLERLVKHPNYMMFKRYEKTRKSMVDWAHSKNNSELVHCLEFLFAVDEFKKINSRSLVKIRAKALVKKFLAGGAKKLTCVVREKVVALEDKVEYDDNLKKICFDDCCVEVNAFVEDEFVASFESSKQFVEMERELRTHEVELQVETERIRHMVSDEDDAYLGGGGGRGEGEEEEEEEKLD
ncbi:hypothetical protein ScalyP_jg11904 [Parmales sp. scaly parma]|nr:hypothetical protein ScalyP_jg11904 [Parmales sp. scaly parma]